MSRIKIIRIIFSILLAAMLVLLSLALQTILKRNRSPYYELEQVLRSKETLIDAAVEEGTAYALISREGRSDYADLLLVLNQKVDRSWERVYENDFTGIKPWKLDIADVDGDGIKEILTAVTKTTLFDPVEKNRMFIFNYEENKLVKKWTGSQIAGTWVDFRVNDLVAIPGEELIFVSLTEEGEEYLRIYYWFHFGFFMLAESEPYDDIVDITVTGENRIEITYYAKEEPTEQKEPDMQNEPTEQKEPAVQKEATVPKEPAEQREATVQKEPTVQKEATTQMDPDELKNPTVEEASSVQKDPTKEKAPRVQMQTAVLTLIDGEIVEVDEITSDQ